MIKAYLIRLGVIIGLMGSVYAANVELKDGHPQKYFVKEGDTLWDIASLYLESPWQWPEIWYRNEQVENPHLIYPGDVLTVIYVQGQPQIVVNNEAEPAPETAKTEHQALTSSKETVVEPGVVKLSPRIRERPINASIPAIPLESIQSYLTNTRVISFERLDSAPHIIAAEDKRIIAGKDDIIYARDKKGDWETLYANYGVYRAGEEYIDPDTGVSLGFEALALGNAKVLGTNGEVATLRVSDATEEIRINDKLVASEERRVEAVFYPKGPQKKVQAKIIRVFNSISHVGRHDVVVINRGKDEGLEEGHVLSVMQAGEIVRDRVNDEFVELPAGNAGLIILFRTFDRVSYGVVLKSRRAMAIGDYVTNPQYGY